MLYVRTPLNDWQFHWLVADTSPLLPCLHSPSLHTRRKPRPCHDRCHSKAHMGRFALTYTPTHENTNFCDKFLGSKVWSIVRDPSFTSSEKLKQQWRESGTHGFDLFLFPLIVQKAEANLMTGCSPGQIPSYLVTVYRDNFPPFNIHEDCD